MHVQFTSYMDQNITRELAGLCLPTDKVVTGMYTNRRVHRSVVHSHPYYEHIYMIRGKATYHINGSCYELHPGELMLIPPGIVHAGVYDGYDRLIMQIDAEFWEESLRICAGGENGSCVHGFPYTDVLIFRSFAVHKWGMRQMIERAAAAADIADAEAREVLYRGMLTQWSVLLDQMLRGDSVGGARTQNAMVEAVTMYIQEHFREQNLSVHSLADCLFVSREHLSRVFKQLMNQSVYDYITELRLQSCRADLASGKSILDACMENGFSNYSSFLKTFRKRYEMSPQEYRRYMQDAIGVLRLADQDRVQ